MYRIWTVRYRVLLCLGALAAVIGLAVGVGHSRSAAAPADTAPDVALPIIMYHSILEDAGRQGAYVITTQTLESDLRYLQERGYTTVVMADLLAYVWEGTPLPERPVMLTFDDGYYNNYAYAHPLLQKYGMRAVIAPIARWTEFYSDRPEEQDRPLYSHATWAQLREMTGSGVWEVQNHSYDLHQNLSGGRKGARKLAGESADRYRQVLTGDLSAAQNLLTRQVGVTPTTFVYPFGAYSKEARPILQELGFSASFLCEGRVNCITRDPECLWGLGRYLRPAGTDSAAYFDPIFRAADNIKGD